MTSLEQSTPPPGLGDGREPARVLGVFDASCVVIGAIIGVGIFFTPSRVVDLTGSGGLALAAWAIGGAIALCGALTFAALGTRYHASGAQYEILRDSYGPLPAFAFVFCNSTAIQPGAIAIIGVICAQNLGVAVSGTEPTGFTLQALTCVLIAGLMVANIVGVRWGSRIQNVTVLAKVLTLLAITGLALSARPEAPPELRETLPRTAGPVAAILAALVPAFFAYGGWQHALWIAGEVREPRRNLPRAIVGGVLLVVVVYLLANWAYLRLLGESGVAGSTALAADAVTGVVGDPGRRVIAGAVAISAFGVLNAQLLSGPRLLFGMAKDGRFFSPFARLHPGFATPSAAILLLGLMAIALLLVAGFNAVDRLLTGVVAIDGVFFGLTGLSIFVLRRRARFGAARIALYPIVPALFVIGELGIVAGSFLDRGQRIAAMIGIAWIAMATLLYLLRFRSTPGRDNQ